MTSPDNILATNKRGVSPRPLSLRKKIFLALLANVMMFGIVEMSVRVGGYLAFNRSPYFLFYGFESWMADSDPEGHTVAGKGYFKFPPNKLLKQYGLFKEPTPIQINSAGFRGPDFAAEKPEDGFRIVCLGGSSTFGFYDRDAYTYPAILQRLFSERSRSVSRAMSTNASAQGKQVEVLNAGIPHAKSENLLAMLRGELLGYKPDLITIYTGYNDAMFVKDANAIQRLSRWMHSHLATYVALKNAITALGGPELRSRWAKHAETSPEDVRHQIEMHGADYESNLASIIKLAERNGFSVVLIKQPIDVLSEESELGSGSLGYREKTAAIRARLDAGGSVRGDEMSHLVHSTLMETLERLGREHNLPVVDFISVVDQHPEFFASYVHLTEEANARLAELLFEVLTASP